MGRGFFLFVCISTSPGGFTTAHRYCLFGLCITLGANVFLGGNCYYQLGFRSSLRGGRNCVLTLRGLLSKECRTNALFRAPFSDAVYPCGPERGPPAFSTPKRVI